MSDAPKSLLIADLLSTHPSYDAGKIALIRAYYDGGDSFPKASELRKKPIEFSSDPCAEPLRKARLNAAFYTDYFADTIADQVSAICKNGIEIDNGGIEDYYEKIEDNADGSFSSATAESRAALTDDFLFNRGVYLVKFPSKKDGKFLGSQIENGELDAQITALDCECVTDWKVGSDSLLDMAITYEMELTRVGAIGARNTEMHTWTIYTRDAVNVYTATKPAPKPGESPTKWEDGQKANIDETQSAAHELGVCPVFFTNRKLKFFVGDKLLPTARQLFNEESDASFYQFTLITGGIFLKTDMPEAYTRGLTITPFGAVLLQATDTIERDRVDAAALQALASATAERRGQLGGLIHNMARQSATQSASGQNTSRNTGVALVQQGNPLNAFLRGFAEAHITTWRQMITAIARVREDNIDGLTITGLMPVDEDEDISMDEETKFAALPNVPQEGKDARGKALALIVNSDADDETLDKIKNAAAPKPIIAPVAPSLPFEKKV